METDSSFSADSVLCRVCGKQFSKYTCPRCNARYCSLSCFKGHNSGCTESFYGEQATEELKGLKASEESKKEMRDILERYEKAHFTSRTEPFSTCGFKLTWTVAVLSEVYCHSPCHLRFSCRLYRHDLGDDDSDDSDDDNENYVDGDSLGDLDQDLGLSDATLQRVVQKLEQGLELEPSDFNPEELAAFYQDVSAGKVPHEDESDQGAGSAVEEELPPWYFTQAALEVQLNERGCRLITSITEEGRKGDNTSISSSSSTALSFVSLPHAWEDIDLSQVVNISKTGSQLALLLPDSGLPPLHRLSQTPPSPLLRVTLVSTVYAYCAIARTWGARTSASRHENPWAPHDDGQRPTLLSAVQTLLHITKGCPWGLGGDTCSQSGAKDDVGSSTLVSSLQPALEAMSSLYQRDTAVHVLLDVALILEMGSEVTLVVLADTFRLLWRAYLTLTSSLRKTQSKKETQHRVRELHAAVHKLFFLATWVNQGRNTTTTAPGGSGSGSGSGGEGGSTCTASTLAQLQAVVTAHFARQKATLASPEKRQDGRGSEDDRHQHDDRMEMIRRLGGVLGETKMTKSTQPSSTRSPPSARKIEEVPE